MDYSKLKKFAQYARKLLMEEISSKLESLLSTENSLVRANPQAFNSLKEALENLKKTTKDEKEAKNALVERVSYIWFNRFCALRFMDLNNFTSMKVVSPLKGEFNPEILASAKAGYIDSEIISQAEDVQEIKNLLNGTKTSDDPFTEAYKLLLIGVCKYYSKQMPFLFSMIEDYTQLLIPEDLFSGNSILTLIRENLYPERCVNESDSSPNVEVIGWLYQYYISERKDEVFNSFKKGKKALAKDIPAATQLFTPHWIVKYLVENSLGRLWILNKPNSCLREKMEYFIEPENEIDFLKISSVEEIKVCDPACGSGHILVYAFDLLYEMYLEEGFTDDAEIVKSIISKNLYGIEIDERAAELAAFAITMKARYRDRKLFSRAVEPNICLMKNVNIDEDKLKSYIEVAHSDLFTSEFLSQLKDFREAQNYGALINPKIKDTHFLRKHLEAKGLAENLFTQETHKKVLKVLDLIDYLLAKYHVVVANPPYMGGKNMNPSLAEFAKKNYPNTKSDLFAMFMERNFFLTKKQGYLGFMTPFVWMFISSYEKLRNFVIDEKSISSLIQLEYSGFDGATVPICTFVCKNDYQPKLKGTYIRLSDFKGAKLQEPKALEAIQSPNCKWRFTASTEDFKKIPGNPIAYWVSERVREIFKNGRPLSAVCKPAQGLATADNGRFLREWFEVGIDKVGFGFKDRESAQRSGLKWFPYNKGGSFRKWYGNNEYFVNWEDDGEEIRNFKDANGKVRSRPQNDSFYFRDAITWTFISSSNFGLRYTPTGFLFDVAGSSCFPSEKNKQQILGLLASSLTPRFLAIQNPTLNFQVGNIANIPVIDLFDKEYIISIVNDLIHLSQQDWDSYERSWDFKTLPLIDTYKNIEKAPLTETYKTLRAKWQSMTDEMKRLEEENNKIFIEAYGLEEELTAEVPLKEITLTCNPHYRYDSKKSAAALEKLLLEDTIKEFISYAVGCMFGRYSLDKAGLILANQGETLNDYLKAVPEPGFMPDEDNVIPVLEEEWFNDDIVNRFKNFLKVSLGEENYELNLSFIEEALGKDIRKYFMNDFYDHHVKQYKKRPIYWMFSSPKASFNVLIYMHRYNENTINVILNEYLRHYREKLTNLLLELENISNSESKAAREKIQAVKDIDKTKKILKELSDYEQTVLFPLATEKIKIDLDDGVKINYNKFTGAVQKISGLTE
ncbi:MAG: BREX-1 system adenine-specific DNA-methyltransferase PglX [Cyanobacteria bacterium REEB446]|nr:BREX-1 system adenine-specific DNA-methyltransferase PglX [Cyanobacteria bacterium REEB446]